VVLNQPAVQKVRVVQCPLVEAQELEAQTFVTLFVSDFVQNVSAVLFTHFGDDAFP